jgi:hypothetical protein
MDRTSQQDTPGTLTPLHSENETGLTSSNNPPFMWNPDQLAQSGQQDPSPVEYPTDQLTPPGPYVPSQFHHKTLFLGGLRPNVNKQDLNTYFGKFGKICNINLKLNLKTNCNKGYAFINFKDPSVIDTI